jgi:hydrophobic/amphiphilic exporter-1 (mainly G- bacteria), HAE1 family
MRRSNVAKPFPGSDAPLPADTSDLQPAPDPNAAKTFAGSDSKPAETFAGSAPPLRFAAALYRTVARGASGGVWRITGLLLTFAVRRRGNRVLIVLIPRASIEGAGAGVFRDEGGRERDIRVRLHEDARARTAQLADLQVRTAQGPIALGALGAFAEQTSPPAIQRLDRVRTAQIDAQVGAGSLTDAVAAVEARMADYPLPPGYAWRLGGQAEQFSDTVGVVLMALLLAITLTYIVLAMLLESFVHPFTIMLTLPLGAVGAVLGLFLWGTTMNIFSMMAIMLVGIVVNSAILILDYTAQLRARGRGLVDALLEAAPARLRAIVMTNLAIVCALVPQAVARGAGAVFRVPMAVVTMGGVLLSAVFTLLLIPVIYAKLDWLDTIGRRASGDTRPEEAASEVRVLCRSAS